MADPEQIAAVVRFALNELGARNAHHDFEHICRHVARARIAANVLPATGPVSAGGDQGRDAETYTTHLPHELPGTSAFTVGTSGKLVIACTTQQGRLDAKVQADIQKIMAEGDVDEIHYFCTVDVPIAQRHALQQWARVNHAVQVEVHDVQALGQHLADRDLFWVAERYLNLPAELRPDPAPDQEGLPEWYVEARERWRHRGEAPVGLGELVDIKHALRHATFDDLARVDLPFWLALMRHTCGASSERLRQRARYEVAVATLRGQDTLEPAEPEARAFIAASMNERTPALLEDASVLLMYCVGAYRRGLTTFQADEITGWNALLRQHLRNLLDEQSAPNRRAALLNVLAHLAMHPDLTGSEPPGDAQSLSMPSEISAAIARGETPMLVGTEPPTLVALDEAFENLRELVDILPTATMFPVDGLATWYALITPLLVDDPRYTQIRDALDERLATVTSRAAVADACRRRALALLKAGRYVASLREFHQAKADWWSGDTVRGSLLAMLLISSIYQRLRLPTAARYYALAAAATASGSGDEDLADLIAKALSAAADVDHSAGAWLTETALVEITVRAHAVCVDTVFDMEQYEYLEPLMVNEAMVLLVARQTSHSLVPLIENRLRNAGVFDLIDNMVGSVSGHDPRTRQEWLDLTDEQLFGRPFSDVGPARVLRWSALGLDWTIRTRNRRLHVLAAERLAAAAQILCVELLDNDLVLMPTTIDIFVETRAAGTEDGGPRVLPSNDGRSWNVALTEYQGPGSLDDQAAHAEVLTALASILSEASLLPAERFSAVLEAAFRGGLVHKLSPGRPYDDVADLFDDDPFSARAVQYAEPLASQSDFPTKAAAELSGQTGPGPTYTSAQAEGMLRNRYDVLPKMLALTLPRLRADPTFRHVVGELRARGWLDWHILTAAANIAMNYRLREAGMLDSVPPVEQRAELMNRATALETADMPLVPLSLFTRAAMEEARTMALPPLVKHWDLSLNQFTPDFPAITQVLADRYGYWTDDVLHDEVLAHPPVVSSSSSDDGDAS